MSCDVCGDEGAISGWEGSPADVSGLDDSYAEGDTISTGRSDPADLLGLSVWLANTIVGPISKDDGYTPLGVLQRVVATDMPGC